MGRIEDERQPADSIYQQGFFPCAICGEMVLWTRLIVEEKHTYGDGSGICCQCYLQKADQEREEYCESAEKVGEKYK
jgi:hypothetical protein